jgi:hypothetical protein
VLSVKIKNRGYFIVLVDRQFATSKARMRRAHILTATNELQVAIANIDDWRLDSAPKAPKKITAFGRRCLILADVAVVKTSELANELPARKI